MNNEQYAPFWNLASDASRPGVLNMYVYGRITSESHWLWGDETDVVTSSFIKDLRRFSGVNHINVYVNSPGGDVFAAAAIKNQLRAHSAEVVAHIDGLAASAAVGLALGADTVRMSRSALLMIHNPSTSVRGEVKDLTKGVEILNKVKETIMAIYMEKTNLTEEQLADMMDEETWLTADEALEYGFIDTIIEDQGLRLENGAMTNGIVVNGVSFDFEDNLSMQVGDYVFSNIISKDKLQKKLEKVGNYHIKTHEQGGSEIMDFEAILNAPNEEQQTLLDEYVQAATTRAMNEKQAEWDGEKKSLEAQIEALKEEEMPDDQGSEDAIFNSLSEEAQALIVEAHRQTAEAEAKLMEAEKEKELTNFRASMEKYDALPIEDKHIDALYTLSVSDEENFAAVEELLKVANGAMSAGFTPAGDDEGKDVTDNAFAEVNERVTKLRADDEKLAYNDALKQVFNDDPELYQRYRAELV